MEDAPNITKADAIIDMIEKTTTVDVLRRHDKQGNTRCDDDAVAADANVDADADDNVDRRPRKRTMTRASFRVDVWGVVVVSVAPFCACVGFAPR